MDTRTFYKRGIDSWTLRQSLRHRVRISTARRGESSSVAARVDMLIDQKRQLEEAWARAPKPQSIQDEELYKKDMAEHDTAIKHLEQLATSAMIDQLLSGNTIGLGYLSRSTLQPIPIPISEWAFLELDMRKSIATFEDGTGYKAVRFLEKGDLSAEEKMWVDSLLCVDELSEIKQESADILPTLEEDRLNQIIETADSLNLDLNNLRRNDKQKIENKCSLTASTFKRIWQYGRDKGVIK